MNDPALQETGRPPVPTVVIVVDDFALLKADLGSLVALLQHFAWSNGPPDIQVVAADTRTNSAPPFIERRKLASDRRQNTHLPAHAFHAASSADPGPMPRTLPDSPAVDRRRRCTDRELEIVDLLRRGMTNKQIAQELGIMEETVKKHLQHIYDKLGVHRRALVMLGDVGARMDIDRHLASPKRHHGHHTSFGE